MGGVGQRRSGRSGRLAIAIGLAIGLGLAGCAGVEPSAAPDTGAETATAAIAPIANVQRAVALSSLSADILHQLAPDKLVGVAHDGAVTERDDLSQYPNIGDGRDFDYEAIAALEPDLAIGLSGVHDRALAKLAEAGVPTLAIAVDGWDGLFETIEILARATDADPTPLLDRYDDLGAIAGDTAESDPEASELTPSEATADETLADKSNTDKADTEPNPTDSDANEANNNANPDRDTGTTLLLASLDPLFSLNRRSWGGSTIALFSDNIAADLDENRSAAGYVTLTPEAIVAADPGTILIVETPGSESPLAGFEALPFWKDLQAVKGDRVFLVDYYGFVRPATLDDIDTAIAQMAEIFGVVASGPAPETTSETPDAAATETPTEAPAEAPADTPDPTTETP